MKIKVKIFWISGGRGVLELPQPDLTLPAVDCYRQGIEHGNAIKAMEARYPEVEWKVRYEGESPNRCAIAPSGVKRAAP